MFVKSMRNFKNCNSHILTMISTLTCAFKSTLPTEWTKQDLFLWSPTNPLKTVTNYFYDETMSQFKTTELNSPNPDPENCITVLVSFSKCQGLMYLPLNELDIGIMGFYVAFPTTTEQGLDGNEVMLIISTANGQIAVFTWKDVISSAPKKLNNHHTIMYIQRAHKVNLTMDLKFQPLSTRFSCEDDASWSVYIASAPTVALPRYVNWIFIPNLFTQVYVEERIRQVLFVFGNVPLYRLNTYDFLGVLCNSFCTFVDEDGALNRHVRDFYVNVKTKLEGVCMGYHLIMHVLFSFPKSALIQQIKQIIVLYGFPVPIFGRDAHGNNTVEISLIPATTLMHLLYSNKQPDNWMHHIEMQMGYLPPLFVSDAICMVDKIDPACVFDYVVTDLPALLFGDVTNPVMMQLYHRDEHNLNARDVINDTLRFTPMYLQYTEIANFQRYYYKPISALNCSQPEKWPTYSCSIKGLHLSKTRMSDDDIGHLNKDSSWRYDQVSYGTGAAVRFYTSQFWFF